MKYKYSNNIVKKSTVLAKSENNDCVVRALSAAADISYEGAHTVCKEHFKREDKKGVVAFEDRLKAVDDIAISTDGVKFKLNMLEREKVKNCYVNKGEEVWRKKTVKSFLKDNPVGKFLVIVRGHCLAVIDGVMVDNVGEEWRPTRKVENAVKVTVLETPQMEFVF